ncbi:toll/interleukin-1 receptor (TIR) domain-containing protein [Artemisia annua]|uniref:Toll/interleukin-1 receptor (TIR) domain-containing protein n=1 Tax=Artemisia annua TaxID=35608 RepID=A0A2U1M1V2_ARTAN|nr:toll/interleukin-1 receptor (TIR) domain-containing protein [Artemisia annua]
MASSSSIPASSSQLWNHDIFLSFRGKDTRMNFVDHLSTRLVEQGIHTYKDDETLSRGESITPTLLKAIRESRMAVIVFSENYADSSWCLDELRYIMECMDERGKIMAVIVFSENYADSSWCLDELRYIMPIFYHVDPSHVRKQEGKYGEAFIKHQLENKNKVDSWRKALVDAGNLAGWEFKQIANGHESKGIKEIVNTISERLFPLISDVDEEFIGLRSRLKHLKSQLEIGSGGVRIVGIWGIGGGGKTTLASSAYDEISNKFDGCCFVDNIRERSNKTHDGLEKLQEKVISDVLRQKKVRVGRVEEGRRLIKKRLCHRNVLIVLDDVDHLEQLEALAGSHDWFGEGSRIIITTRDSHLLNANNVNVMHDISLLNNDEAIKLFSKHAPQGNRPIEDYEHFSQKVVSYAGGLPLALKVLGRFLCDKDMNEWISAIARLKEIPETDIVEKLKISFDGLKTTEKELFLDVACFFRHQPKDKAMEILDACGFHPVIGIKVLIQKALIFIDLYGMIDMHDLVQEMGHYIVSGEYPKNPEQYSRVWKEEDVRKICAMDMELNKIKAIAYFSNSFNKIEQFEGIANMKKLRLIEWEDLPGSSLPTNFLTGELRCLILSSCRQRHLWEGYKFLPNLRFVNLSHMRDLIMTPDISGLPNLERFRLFNCKHIEHIHTSIGHSEGLVFLEIQSCSSFIIFPPITMSKRLKTLKISNCPDVFRVAFLTPQQLDNAAVGVSCCLVEPSLPHTIDHKGLTKLYINNFKLRDDDSGSVVGAELPNLQELDLSWNKFSRINFSTWKLPRLKYLNLSRCKNLVVLLDLPSSIAVLKADDCHSLETIGNISNCKWLWKVSLNGWYARPIVGEILNSMRQGNAIEDHFISLLLPRRCVIMKFVDRFVRGERFTLQLPHKNWHDDFCGLKLCIVTAMHVPVFTIIVKPEMGKDFQSEVWQVSSEAPETCPYGKTYVGYVSFNLIKKHTPWWNSAYSMISISVTGEEKSPCVPDLGYDINYGCKLVPEKIQGDELQTRKVARNFSEFWDNEKTFTIQHVSNSSIKIVWRPHRELQA